MSLAYFPLYPDRYEADTAHLSILEDGAYNRLLRLCWRSPGCKIPDDKGWIYRQMRAASNAEKAAIDAVMAEFFRRAKGKTWNPKLLEIYEQVLDAHRIRSEAGKQGVAAKALKRAENTSSNAKAKLKQPEPEPEPNKTIALSRVSQRAERFDEFWAAYPHRGGVKRGRKPSQAKYERVVRAGTSEQSLIDAARRYATDRRVIDGFAKDPSTWLNQDGWLDEVEVRASPVDPDRAAKLAQLSRIAGAK